MIEVALGIAGYLLAINLLAIVLTIISLIVIYVAWGLSRLRH